MNSHSQRPVGLGLVLFTIFLVSASLAQTGVRQVAPQDLNRPTDSARRIMVQGLDGGVTIGQLVGISGETLIVLAKGREQYFPIRSLLHVTIGSERNTGSVLPGLVLGAYIGNMLFLRAENQPGAYLQKMRYQDEYLIVTILNSGFMAAGGMLTSVINARWAARKHVFDLSRRGVERQKELDRLREFATEGGLTHRWRLSTYGAKVLTSIAGQYRLLKENAGYTLEPYGGEFDDVYIEPASDINLLRDIQVTYSLTKNVSAGFAYSLLGEPSSSFNKFFENGDAVIKQSLNVPAYHVLINYTVVSKIAPKIDMTLGVGLGAAAVDFSLQGLSRRYVYPNSVRVELAGGAKATKPSGRLTFELKLPVADRYTVGLAADYVYVVPINVPGMPEFDLPAQTIRPGNISLGIRLGLNI